MGTPLRGQKWLIVRVDKLFADLVNAYQRRMERELGRKVSRSDAVRDAFAQASRLQ